MPRKPGFVAVSTYPQRSKPQFPTTTAVSKPRQTSLEVKRASPQGTASLITNDERLTVSEASDAGHEAGVTSSEARLTSHEARLTSHEARLTAGKASDIYVSTLTTSSEAPR